jgi:hypothetical protein
MIAWGVAMPLCGAPPESALGWALAGWLGLFSGVFEGIQVIRDHDADDSAAGVRTTAVALGVARTLALVRVMLGRVCAVYGALVVSPWLAALPALPRSRCRSIASNVTRTWNQVRMILGSRIPRCAVGWVWWSGATARGARAGVPRDDARRVVKRDIELTGNSGKLPTGHWGGFTRPWTYSLVSHRVSSRHTH